MYASTYTSSSKDTPKATQRERESGSAFIVVVEIVDGCDQTP